MIATWFGTYPNNVYVTANCWNGLLSPGAPPPQPTVDIDGLYLQAKMGGGINLLKKLSGEPLSLTKIDLCDELTLLQVKT